MKRVCDIISNEEIKSWNYGEIITIKAGTGRGKSYFVKNVLYGFAKQQNKKILMLIHRTNCVNQFQLEIEKDNKTDIIDIKTYQHLEAMKKKGEEFDFTGYSYVICDEFHYFMSDAAFNKTTDISLNTILNLNSKIRVFMSATGDVMKRYINNVKKKTTIDYELPITFDFIRELTFFNKDESMEKFIEEAIEKKEKAIFFIQSAKQAYELYKKYKDYCVFNCGKSDKHYKHVDEEKINEILLNEKFEELILITTTCFDAGVNIIDVDLKHIVCSVKDTGVLIQCIGRKRPQSKDDKINLYIKTITNQQLGGIQTQLNKKLKMAKFLREHTVQEYISKYQRELDYSHIVYDDIIEGESDKSTKKVNELMYFKCLTDVNEISAMKLYGEYSYCKYLAHLFGFYDDFYNRYTYRLIEEDYMKDILEEYLSSLVGEKLFKDEQKELINKIDLRVNRKQQRSCAKLNEGLKMLKLGYVIIKDIDKRRKLEDGSHNPNRDKTYWMIIKTLG